MIFSVFDHHARAFDYYEAPGRPVDFGARGTKYRPLSGAPQLTGPVGGRERLVVGHVAESLAMALPAGAVHVGRGSVARGVCAVRCGPQGCDVGTYAVVQSGALSGLGDAEAAQPPAAQSSGPSFGQVVGAAVIASVVGVLVNRALTKGSRRRR